MTRAASIKTCAIFRIIVFLVISPLLLSGCSGWVETEQTKLVDKVNLSESLTVGQTFVSKYNGLTGVYFYLSPQEAGTGEIRLHLRNTPKAKDDLALSSTVLRVVDIKAPGYYGFFLPAQSASNQKYYYAYLEVTGSGVLQVGKAAGDSYLNGALYQNGIPMDAQAGFQLSFSRRKAISGLGFEAVIWLGILAVGLFLFVLPGWGLIGFLWPRWGELKWPDKLGLSAGMSLAIYPLLFLWTGIIGLHLGAIYAWLPPLMGAGLIVWRKRKSLLGRSFTRINLFSSLHANHNSLPLADLALVAITVVIILTRFWVIRSLDLPLWGDSYQHTMMAQLLVDHGGLFNSWLPYADLQTLTYHFGFHTTVAVFDWITHLDISKAVLWVGQLLNILAVISLYPLAKKVGRSDWAGVAAVLVAGMLSPMPMYYVNWGRYTQLAGQVILPCAIYLAWTILESEYRDWRFIGMGWLVLAGLALTHYLVTIFAGLFFIAFLLFRIGSKEVRKLLVKSLFLLAGVLVLFFPWFVHVFLGTLPKILAFFIKTPTKAGSTYIQDFNSIGNISFFLPVLLWLLMFLCVAWGLWRREKNILLIGLWWLLNLLATNPQWLHLPGAGVITNITLFIASYIPAGILIGAGFGWFLQWLEPSNNLGQIRGRSWSVAFAAALFLFSIGLVYIPQRLGDLQVKTSTLVTRPDMQAAKWIQQNTPKDVRFLVNSFFAYGGSLLAGSDGGWWLPLLANRQTTLPPITYGSEQGPTPDYRLWINRLTSELQSKDITQSDALALLRERGVNYIYLGQRQGRVNYDGPNIINLEKLLSSSYFHVIYHQDRVWIFEVVR